MDFCREVSFSGEYPQEKKVPSTACSKLGGLSAGSLDDLFSTQNMVSASLPLIFLGATQVFLLFYFSNSPCHNMGTWSDEGLRLRIGVELMEVLLFSLCTSNTCSTIHAMGLFNLLLGFPLLHVLSCASL